MLGVVSSLRICTFCSGQSVGTGTVPTIAPHGPPWAVMIRPILIFSTIVLSSRTPAVLISSNWAWAVATASNEIPNTAAANPLAILMTEALLER